jgi:hypothetical protein
MMKKLRYLCTLLLLAVASGVWAQTETDVMTADLLEATDQNYKDFSDVKITSDAVYAGNNSLNNKVNIQLRSKNNSSGIVSTESGGKILTVKITVASGSNTVDVYGSNTAYTSAADLYDGNKQGTKLGSISSTGTVSVSGDYKYVGVRANNGAVYLSSIEFTWNTSTAATAAAPTFSPAGGTYIEAQSVTISSATEGATIYYTLDGSTPTTSSTKYTGPITISENKTLKAIATSSGMNNSAVNSADYIILNVADAMTVADGISYTNEVGTEASEEAIMVKGIISQVDGMVGDNSITYWISDDGTTTNQMEVYKGKGINGADFSAVTDLKVGDKVVVYGKVKMFKDTPEFDSGMLLSLEENTDPYIDAPDVVNLAYDATEGLIDVSLENASIAIVGGTIEEGCTWLSDLNITNDGATFKATVNESSDPREATITFTGAGVSKVVTIIQAGAPIVYDNIPDLFAAATSTEKEVLVKFGGWHVTGVSGSNVFVSDGSHGFIIYCKDHGFDKQEVLSSETPISCTLKLYRGSAELVNFKKDTEGLNIASGGGDPNTSIEIADLSGINTGAVVKYINLTCEVVDGTDYYLTDGTNYLKVYKTLYSEAFSKLEDGKKYDIIGVYQQFDETKEILPRWADDIIPSVGEITVEIGETGYATLFYKNYALEIPEGVTASYVAGLNGKQLITETLGGLIPAETGVILEGEPGEYKFKVSNDASSGGIGMLYGTDEEETIDGNGDNYYYKFVNEKDGVGFWWGATDGGPFKNGAHKAYLVVPKDTFEGDALAKIFIFGGEGLISTGINQVDKIAEDAAIYNLNGVRVNKVQKGVYVVNGKKVVIK